MTIPCTILVPTKDRPGLLARALSSALKAAPSNAEILVVDDGSSPPAQEVTDSFNEPRLRVVVNQGDHGAAGARNFGMLQARGTIVFFLDDDDELMPDYCDHILTEVIPNAPEIDYGFSAYKIAISDDSDRNLDSIGGKSLRDGTIGPDTPFRRRMFGLGMGFWIRRDVFKAVGPLAEDLTVLEDWEYSFRLFAADKTAWYSTCPGARLHPHPHIEEQGNLGHLTTCTDNATFAACVLAIYRRYPHLIKSNRQASRYLARAYLKYIIKSGDLKSGWRMVATLPNFGDRLLARIYALLKFAAYRRAQRRRVR